MAKKKSQLNDYVELQNGSKLYLLPINEADIQGIIINLRNEFIEQGLPLDAPTYTTEVEEVFAWDAESVEKDGSDEDKQKWAEHEATLREFNTQQEYRVMYYVFTESPYKLVTSKGNEIDLSIDELEPDFNPPDAWIKKQANLGYALPDNPYDRKYDFLRYLVKGVEAQREIIVHAIALNLKGAVSDEGVLKYEAMFRGQMEKAGQETEARLDAIIERVGEMA